MSLNNKQMLPERIRSMRQMKDILDAEDIVLGEVDRIIDEMYYRATFLHEELVNEAWLESRLSEMTKGVVRVWKRKGELWIEIELNMGVLSGQMASEVVEFLEKWLPAHLAYGVTYEKEISASNYFSDIWQDDEVFILCEAGAEEVGV